MRDSYTGVGLAGRAHGGLTRRDFLRVGGAATLGLWLAGAGRPARAQTASSAPDLGISPGNSPGANRSNLVKALSNSGRSVYFPPGDYRVDNSGSYVIINNFSGTVTMAAGARFVFTDNTRRGLMFQGGTGATFEGLTSAFGTPPQSRVQSQECILFIQTTDTAVRRADVFGSAAAGILFGRCVRPLVDGADIRNTMADGLHFANCQDARANDVVTSNTGDDGLAFLNYTGGTDYSGGLATNVTVNGSQSRGIAVVGQRNVTIRGFAVNGTASSGLYCAYEASFGTRTPSNVQFENGTVRDAGRLPTPRGHKNGITFSNPASVAFSGVRVYSPAQRGVSGAAPGGVVSISGVSVQDVPEAGFNLQGGRYKLDGLTARATGKTGVYVGGADSVSYGVLTAVDAARRDGLRRAFSFEKNRRVVGQRLNVVDRKQRPTGYKVNAAGTRKERLGKVYDRVSRGSVKVENARGLNYAVR